MAVLSKDDTGALSNDDDEEKLDEVFQLGFDEKKNCTFSAILRTLQLKVNGVSREIRAIKKQAERENKARMKFTNQSGNELTVVQKNQIETVAKMGAKS